MLGNLPLGVGQLLAQLLDLSAPVRLRHLDVHAQVVAHTRDGLERVVRPGGRAAELERGQAGQRHARSPSARSRIRTCSGFAPSIDALIRSDGFTVRSARAVRMVVTTPCTSRSRLDAASTQSARAAAGYARERNRLPVFRRAAAGAATAPRSRTA